jgi:biopolymer transport protein TolQ
VDDPVVLWLPHGRSASPVGSYEAEFWKSRDIDAFQAERGGGKNADLPVAKVVSAALAEWRRSATGKIDRSGARERLASVMDNVVAAEAESWPTA